MATKTVTLDDLDGSEGAETFTFSVGEDAYEVDLTSANVEAFKRAIKKFTDVARPGKTKKAAGTNGDTAKIREWLNANNHPVGPKGRIPEEKMAIWKAAHPEG